MSEDWKKEVLKNATLSVPCFYLEHVYYSGGYVTYISVAHGFWTIKV